MNTYLVCFNVSVPLWDGGGSSDKNTQALVVKKLAF